MNQHAHAFIGGMPFDTSVVAYKNTAQAGTSVNGSRLQGIHCKRDRFRRRKAEGSLTPVVSAIRARVDPESPNEHIQAPRCGGIT